MTQGYKSNISNFVVEICVSLWLGLQYGLIRYGDHDWAELFKTRRSVGVPGAGEHGNGGWFQKARKHVGFDDVEKKLVGWNLELPQNRHQ